MIRVDNFQLGCIMEPTLDPRMTDLMLLVAGSRARPAHRFVLQTNGLLLHRHDHAKMRDAGLTHLSASIDSADPATHKLLRGGSSLSKTIANIVAFVNVWNRGPTVCVSFAFGFHTNARSSDSRIETYSPCGVIEIAIGWDGVFRTWTGWSGSTATSWE